MSQLDLDTIDLDTLQALLEKRGLKVKPATPSASKPKVSAPTAVQLTKKPAAQLAAQPVVHSAKHSTTQLATQQETIPSSKSSAKVTAKGPMPKLASKPSTIRPSGASYLPYCSPRRSVPSLQSKLAHPWMKLKIIKKPRGTPGRKGKTGWPEPICSIFGTTLQEHQFIRGIIKRLAYKKLDTTKCLRDQEAHLVLWVIEKTFKFIPELKDFRSNWVVRAFIQVILKSAKDSHRKQSRALTVDPSLFSLAGLDDKHKDQEITEQVNAIVDRDSSNEEYGAKNNLTMASAANLTLGGIDTTMVSVLGRKDSDDEDNLGPGRLLLAELYSDRTPSELPITSRPVCKTTPWPVPAPKPKSKPKLEDPSGAKHKLELDPKLQRELERKLELERKRKCELKRKRQHKDERKRERQRELERKQEHKHKSNLEPEPKDATQAKPPLARTWGAKAKAASISKASKTKTAPPSTRRQGPAATPKSKSESKSEPESKPESKPPHSRCHDPKNMTPLFLLSHGYSNFPLFYEFRRTVYFNILDHVTL